ncbi:MAG: hypothetical protein U1F24_09920 [Alphaproteobacteria bacterium]|jgi:hypothetical protein
MKILGIAAVAAGALVLAACGGGSSHAVCKDEKSATEYAAKWAADLQAAATAGKIDMAKLAEAGQEMQKELSSVGATDYGAGCTKLDELRKKIGF